jgi:chromosome segregation ATPase
MEEQTTNTTEEPREGIAQPGKRQWGTRAPDSGFSNPEPPRVIDISHRPPQRKPRVTRIPEAAKAKLADAQAAAEKARQEIEQIEYHYRDRERDLDELTHNIRTQTKGLDVFRRGLANLEPSALAKNWEDAYWRHVHDPFDRDIANQWLLVASLRSNSKELRAMLTKKLEESEGSIAAMERQRAALEKELGAEAASIK